MLPEMLISWRDSIDRDYPIRRPAAKLKKVP